MDLLVSVGTIWLNALAWLGGLAVVFLVLTRFSPCNPGKSWWADRRAAVTDLVYWLVLPLITQFGRVALLVGGVLLIYGGTPPDDFALRRLPIWGQCLLILLIQDVLMYWLHRLFHTSAGWRFHAVHHSPEVLDWTSTTRFHPVNAVLEFAVVDAAVLLMGFSPIALAWLGPINLAYSVMVHANLNWTFGPLRYVLASPVFHRWHHTSAEEGRDRNFASTFPVLDLMWGTYHMPVGKRPEVYGASGDVPAGFVGQTLYPFRGLGAWGRRHPAWAGAGLVVVCGLTAVGVHEMTRPIETTVPPDPEVAQAEPPKQLTVTIPPQERRVASAVAVTAGGGRVILGGSDGTAFVLDPATKTQVRGGGHLRRVNALAVGPGGWAVSAGGDGEARVWDVTTGEMLRVLGGHKSAVVSVAVSGDGWTATGTADGVVRVWNPDGELIHSRQTGKASVHAVGVSDGGRRVVAACLSDVTTWDTANDTAVSLTGHTDLPYTVALTADGKQAVTGGYDGRVIVWDSTTGMMRHDLRGHAGPVYAVAVSPDGGRVVSGGADRTVRVWEANTGEAVQTFDGHAGMVFAVSLDGGGRRVAAAGKEGTVSVWAMPTGAVVPASAVIEK
jgi:sterol desaturase/sphingolipid hydroxylase (fatty acid hydroxylase superfamily)